MSLSNLNRREFLTAGFGAIAGLTLSSCKTKPPTPRQDPQAIATFEGLHDQNGVLVGPGYFQKPILAVYYGILECPLVCWPDMRDEKKALDAMPQDLRDLIQPVFVCVNHNDAAPEKLQAFAGKAGAVPKDLIVLGGPKEAIAKSASKLLVKYGETPNGGWEHTRFIYAIRASDNKLRHTFAPIGPDQKIDLDGITQIMEALAKENKTTARIMNNRVYDFG